MRRSVHTSGRVGGLTLGLLAVVLFSSCSSPPSPGSDVVASANGVELTRTMLAQLMDSPDGNASTTAPPSSDTSAPSVPSADDTRTVMTQWLQIAAIGHDMSTITDGASLQSEALAASIDLAAPFLGPAADLYSKGFDGSPKVCIGAIPVAAETDPNEIIDAMTNGMTLADAATKYSSDPAFVQSQGVLTFQDGSTCTDPAQLNPDVIKQMNGAKPGEPKLVSLGNGQAIVVIRAFDTLLPTEQISVSPDVQKQVAGELNKRLQGANMFVDKRYGRWDPETSSVVPLVVG
jgi:hypothetical protein